MDDGSERRGMPVTRREVLGALAGGAVVAGAGWGVARRAAPGGAGAGGAEAPAGARMPALFLAHGAPILLDMPDWVAELRSWAAALPRPKSVLMVSAHWGERP